MNNIKSEPVKYILSSNFARTFGSSLGWSIGTATAIVLCSGMLGLIDTYFFNHDDDYNLTNYICECHIKELKETKNVGTETEEFYSYKDASDSSVGSDMET